MSTGALTRQLARASRHNAARREALRTALGVAVEPLTAYAMDDVRAGLVIGYGRLPQGQAGQAIGLVARAVRDMSLVVR